MHSSDSVRADGEWQHCSDFVVVGSGDGGDLPVHGVRSIVLRARHGHECGVQCLFHVGRLHGNQRIALRSQCGDCCLHGICGCTRRQGDRGCGGLKKRGVVEIVDGSHRGHSMRVTVELQGERTAGDDCTIRLFSLLHTEHLHRRQVSDRNDHTLNRVFHRGGVDSRIPIGRRLVD